MTQSFSLTRKLGFALLLSASTLSPLWAAGDQSDAEAAIAVARSKIAAGDKVGTGRLAPELQEQARTALLEAQGLLNNHHKKEAMTAAVRAGELADRALVSGDNRRTEAEQVRRLDTQDAAIHAQQSAANANVRANSAEMMGNVANQRANNAEREAAAANARVDQLRAAAPVAAPQTTTTVVTEHDTSVIAPAPAIRHKVVRKPAPKTHRRITSHRKATTVVTSDQH